MTVLERDTVCVGTMLRSIKQLTAYKFSHIETFADVSGASIYSKKSQIKRFKLALERAYILGLCEKVISEQIVYKSI